VTMMSKSMAMRFSLVLDRPFFFAIHDSKSGGLLFIGWIVRPGTKSSK
jgi:serine protease inhibitor